MYELSNHHGPIKMRKFSVQFANALSFLCFLYMVNVLMVVVGVVSAFMPKQSSESYLC